MIMFQDCPHKSKNQHPSHTKTPAVLQPGGWLGGIYFSGNISCMTFSSTSP